MDRSVPISSTAQFHTRVTPRMCLQLPPAQRTLPPPRGLQTAERSCPLANLQPKKHAALIWGGYKKREREREEEKGREAQREEQRVRVREKDGGREGEEKRGRGRETEKERDGGAMALEQPGEPEISTLNTGLFWFQSRGE